MTASLDFTFPVIAHRGASAFAPENTLVSFSKAVQMGAKWLEFDVMLSADNEVIVFHDETLDRTTNGSGFVGNFPFSYLRTLDAGAWFDPAYSGERIPSLAQIATFLQEMKISANIEIKSLPDQEQLTAQLAFKEILNYFPQRTDKILFSSFSVASLRELRRLSSECNLGLLMHDWQNDWDKICDELQCVSVHVNQQIMNPDRVHAIKNTHRQLLCYTVNNAHRAKELLSWGVDAIFSDIPTIIE